MPSPWLRVPFPGKRRRVGAGLPAGRSPERLWGALGSLPAGLQSVWWDRGAKPLVQLLTRRVAEHAAFGDEQNVRACLPDVHRPPGRA